MEVRKRMPMDNKIKMYNLTIPQENIWLLDRINPNTTINNILGTFRINKKLDVNILNKVINEIVRTNEALRIRIVEENGIAKQYISEYEKETFKVYILNDDDDTEINKIVKRISEEKMQIMNSKLYDIRIIQNKVETCVSVKTHHIISDAWTLGQIAEQIKEYYLKISNDEEIDIKPSYIEYIKKDEAYRLSPRYQSDKEFWNEYIKNLKCKNEYEMPKDKKCKRIEKAIEKELFEKISSFCCENKISEYAFLLGIISVYFSKIFNEDEIIIGTPFLNRRKADKELEMMGMFIATIPINIITKGEMTFIEICKNINTTNLQCFKHSKYPYYEIQKAYQDFSKENINLYEIAFSYQINKLEVTLDGDTGKTTWIPNDTQSNPLLISYVNHFGENLLYYDFLLNCMNKNDIDDMHERIMGIIKQVLENKAIEIKDITPLSETDKKLIIQFNNTGSVGINNQTIVSRFNCIVDENKNKIALICGNNKITYEELNNKANNLCCNIQKEGIYGENIPIILDNEINFIISILGVLKSGNHYIPILPEESIDRVKYIIKDSKSKILITNTKYINTIKVNDIEIINIDDVKDKNVEINQIKILPSDISYIIYTSGTTGKPKGVMMKNENIISLINSMNMDIDLKYLKDDVAVSLLKHSFDASAIDIYSSLLNGGTLVLIPKEDEFNAKKVVETISKNNVTRLFTVHKWIEQIQSVCIENNIKLDKLRIVGTGAEVLNPKKFEKLLLNNPNLSIYNTYGPTEATMFMTKHKVTVEDIQKDYSTIGKLMPTTRAIILDKDNKILPINIQGELGIYQEENSAKNIAKGYLHQDKLSKEKFITLYNEISGSECKCYKTGDIVKLNRNLELEFIGRKDDFVKVAGGYLVSLNEVEQRIKELLGENIEVSVMTSKIKNSNVLILFICKNEKSLNIKTDDIKNIIDENITFYMKPKHIIELDKIPRNKNGKIDRKELDQIANKYLKTRNKIISPQTTLEQMIYDKVKKIVKEDFSITDDFEDDLGLDSLNMTSLYISLGNDKMTIQDLYNYSTVKDLANMMNTEIVNKRENRKENIEVKNISSKFNMNTVLLTGVTGFVGVNLLRELVESKDTEKIYCIVRTKVGLSSCERFENTIKYYFDVETCNLIKKKTIVVNGDLTREDLGILPEELDKIKREVTTVINCAANVKHIGKYANFYKDNVKTVLNILKICKENNINFAHISTLSLHGFKNEDITRVFDENTLNINQTFDKSPYLISKYEAEEIILKAINNKEVNAKIFRIGNIMPRMSDGKFQKNFEQNAFMLAIKEIGNIGLQTIEMINSEIYLTPVDECVKAINIILNSSCNNVIYHIESDKVVKVSDIAKIIRKKYSELNITNVDNLKEKLYENYNVGVEHLKAIINQNTNEYSKDITLNILDDLNFKWNNINDSYLKNIVNIAFKIQKEEEK